MLFKSTDYTGQDTSWRTCSSSLFLMLPWQSLLVCFGSLSCRSRNPWRPTNCVPDWIAGCCSMLWWSVWFNLSFTWCKYPTLQRAKASHPTELLQSLRLVWYRGLRLFPQLFAAHRPSYLTQRNQTLICKSSLYELWSTGAFWHCFPSSTVLSWQQFCPIGQFYWIFSQWILANFFHKIVLVVLYCLDQSTFSYASWWLWWNCPLFLLLLLVYQPYFWSCFVLLSLMRVQVVV